MIFWRGSSCKGSSGRLLAPQPDSIHWETIVMATKNIQTHWKLPLTGCPNNWDQILACDRAVHAQEAGGQLKEHAVEAACFWLATCGALWKTATWATCEHEVVLLNNEGRRDAVTWGVPGRALQCWNSILQECSLPKWPILGWMGATWQSPGLSPVLPHAHTQRCYFFWCGPVQIKNSATEQGEENSRCKHQCFSLLSHQGFCWKSEAWSWNFSCWVFAMAWFLFPLLHFSQVESGQFLCREMHHFAHVQRKKHPATCNHFAWKL